MREAAGDLRVTAESAGAGAAGARTGIIFDVKRYAIHDGPGIRTTVFLKGCPLSCPWCHNPEGIRGEPELSVKPNRCIACGACVAACPQGAIVLQAGRCVTDPARCDLCGRCVEACPSGAREILGRRVGVEDVLAEVEKDVIFYDDSGGGVTFSGGEPLAQPDFLRELLIACAARAIHSAVDTTCHAPWPVLASIAEHAGLFLCDVKHADSAVHERLTGVGNELILANLRKLARLGKPIIVRMPVIPGVNDDEANVCATGEIIRSLEGVQRVDLLAYNEAGKGKLAQLARSAPAFEASAPSPEHVAAIAARLAEFGLAVKTGG